MEKDETQQQVVPVIGEELITGTRQVKTGSVRVRKKVRRTSKTVEMPAVRDVVDVQRIPINRAVSAIPAMREEGDLLIVPVVEEVMVVRKRLILREEIHIRRRRVQSQVAKTVTLEREQATIERLDSEGNVVASSAPAAVKPAKVVQPDRPLRELATHKSLFE